MTLKASPQNLIDRSEMFLLEFYTLIGRMPVNLSSHYMDDAEVVYTGQIAAGDSSLMSGKSEITEFFSSPVMSRFYASRFKVDVVHAISCPLKKNSINIFAKGTVWFKTNYSTAFETNRFVHFLTLTESESHCKNPNLLIANEFFHLLTSSLHLQMLNQKVVNKSVELPNNAYNKIERHSDPVEEENMKTVNNSNKPSGFNSNKRKDDEATLHATPIISGVGAEILGLDVVELCKAVNSALEFGTCTEISRPLNNGSQIRSFFFIHMNSVEAANKIKESGTLVVNGTKLKISPIVSRENKLNNRRMNNNSQFSTRNFNRIKNKVNTLDEPVRENQQSYSEANEQSASQNLSKQRKQENKRTHQFSKKDNNKKTDEIKSQQVTAKPSENETKKEPAQT